MLQMSENKMFNQIRLCVSKKINYETIGMLWSNNLGSYPKSKIVEWIEETI